MRFSTDAYGVPDSSSIEILSSTHQLFANAVLRVLPLWHTTPHSTLSIPFRFALSTKSGREGMSGPITSMNGVPANGMLIVAAPDDGSRAAPAPTTRELRQFIDGRPVNPNGPIPVQVTWSRADGQQAAREQYDGEVAA